MQPHTLYTADSVSNGLQAYRPEWRIITAHVYVFINIKLRNAISIFTSMEKSARIIDFIRLEHVLR